ncbi:fimbrial protein [Pseudocitrobacter corydidari]
MMMIKIKFYTSLFWFAFSLPLLAAQNIHYKGELIAGACELVVNGGIMATVDFKTLSNGNFGSNNQTLPVSFSLSLKNCKTALSTGVLLTFTGVEDDTLPGLLKPEATSIASGFGIGIKTRDQREITFNASQGIEFTLTENMTTMYFEAWLQKHLAEDITPGEFTGTATVNFEYQ